MNKKSKEEEGACYLARQMKPFKAGHPDYLRNLQSSLQNENAAPPFQKASRISRPPQQSIKQVWGPSQEQDPVWPHRSQTHKVYSAGSLWGKPLAFLSK